MSPEEPLESYRSKRHFERTPEPSGEGVNTPEPSGGGVNTPEPYGGGEPPERPPLFVIQKHDASHLHYDFRLEFEGVLKSWAVPKGPSTHPRTMRLALLTEDHPIDYGGFEGVIPEGNYGAGTVMVWDTGTYRNLRAEKPGGQGLSMGQSFADGKIEVWLEGKKLKGAYALIRTKRDEGKSWLLLKMKDEHADQPADPVKDLPDSALTGRTMEQIARDAEEVARRERLARKPA